MRRFYAYTVNEEWKEFMRGCGYEPISNFYRDLTIADFDGVGAIRDTFNRIVSEWLGDYKMFTEFIMCLNHKIWNWYEKNEEIGKLYNDLWVEAEEIFSNKYENNEEIMSYYYRVTD